MNCKIRIYGFSTTILDIKESELIDNFQKLLNINTEEKYKLHKTGIIEAEKKMTFCDDKIIFGELLKFIQDIEINWQKSFASSMNYDIYIYIDKREDYSNDEFETEITRNFEDSVSISISETDYLKKFSIKGLIDLKSLPQILNGLA